MDVMRQSDILLFHITVNKILVIINMMSVNMYQ